MVVSNRTMFGMTQGEIGLVLFIFAIVWVAPRCRASANRGRKARPQTVTDAASRG